jgi:hypothetical protein
MQAGGAAGQVDLLARRFQIAGFGDGDDVAEAFAHHTAEEAARHGVVLDDQHLDGHRATPRLCLPSMLSALNR